MTAATPAEAARATTSAATGPVKVALPAWVQIYDRARQTAIVQIAIAYRVRDARTGALLPRMRPPTLPIPVIWPGGITWDLEEGEWGLCVFADRSIDEWAATGNQAITPADPRRFDVSDAIFIPGVKPPGDPLPSDAYASGAVVLWDRGTSDIRLGSSGAADFVALASRVNTEISRLWTVLTTWIVVPADGGAALKVAAAAAALGVLPVDATKVKAE